MTLCECAALRVLSGKPHGDAVDEQRRVRERLRLSPVDPAFDDRDASPLELARELRVDGEVAWDAQELLVQLDEALGGDGGGHLRCRRARDLAVVIELPGPDE